MTIPTEQRAKFTEYFSQPSEYRHANVWLQRNEYIPNGLPVRHTTNRREVAGLFELDIPGHNFAYREAKANQMAQERRTNQQKLPFPCNIPNTDIEAQCIEMVTKCPNKDRTMDIQFLGDSTMRQLVPWIFTVFDSLNALGIPNLPTVGERYIPYYNSGLRLSDLMLSSKIDLQHCNVTIIKLQIDFVNIYNIRARTTEIAQRMENEAITHHVCLLNTLLRNLQIRKPGMAIVLIGPNMVNPIENPNKWEKPTLRDNDRNGVNLATRMDREIRNRVTNQYTDCTYISAQQILERYKGAIALKEINGPHMSHMCNLLIALEVRKYIISMYTNRAYHGLANIPYCNIFDNKDPVKWPDTVIYYVNKFMGLDWPHD